MLNTFKRTTLALALLCALLAAPAWAVVEGVPQSGLVVSVQTDRTFYGHGDTVQVQVRTFLNGAPVAADLKRAALTIHFDDGRTARRHIARDFYRSAPGVYVSRGEALGAGVRELEVTVALYESTPCRCEVVTATGSALYSVNQPVHTGGGAISGHIEFRDLPADPTVCDTVKVGLYVQGPAHVRLLQVFPDGSTKDLVIPSWVCCLKSWIKFKPETFAPGPLTLKLVLKGKHGETITQALTLTLGAASCASPVYH